MSNKRTGGSPAQRGRATPTRPSGVPMPLFYAILVLIAIGGAIFLLSNSQTLRNSALSDNAAKGGIQSSIPLASLPSRGSADAPVTVVEFADFQCPACGSFAVTLEPAIIKDYIDTGKVKWLYHDFPLTQHKNAVPSAEAARCAGDQSAFWPMHDLLFANQAQWENSAQPGTIFAGYASQLKLDASAFEQCLNSGKYRAAVQASYDASVKAGVNQTPTFVIDGKAYLASDLRGAIDTALAAKK
ncbi:MAG TPA: DsbA family protein [Kouleothrix sp.]|uniref:DsbA family protein n=1 Tax=Kouleothrix sp. TaxID=2779161 RepID=UPI002C8AB655|nr:DsbA family protein [Kouleothrix sp.]HRC74312.1 DsbA family protein [Kouleothrix sp.]